MEPLQASRYGLIQMITLRIFRDQGVVVASAVTSRSRVGKEVLVSRIVIAMVNVKYRMSPQVLIATMGMLSIVPFRPLFVLPLVGMNLEGRVRVPLSGPPVLH